MILDFVIIVIGISVGLASGYMLWESSVMLTERNKLRKFTGKYYDFEITEALDKMNITRQQALDELKDK